MKKSDKQEWLNNHWRYSTLDFRWSRSGVCRLYDMRGNKTHMYAGGYGYDKSGTVLGQFLMEFFPEELKKLSSKEYYGLTHYDKKFNKNRIKPTSNTKTYVDGACGFSSMRDILNKIGFDLKFVKETNNTLTYLIRLKNE